MPHNAFYIVDEFLRSDNPQERKNALTALALMTDDEHCLDKLVEVTLADPDEGTYKRGVEEIESLAPRELGVAVVELEEQLADESKGQRAYAALGHLKSLGKLPLGGSYNFLLPISLLTRLKLAWAMNSFLYPTRTTAFRLRVWRPSLVGAVIAVLALLPFYTFQAGWRRDEYLVVPVPLILLAVLTGISATQLTTPINLYFDRKVAFLVETLSAMILTIPIMVPIFLYALLDSAPGRDADDPWNPMFSVMLWLPIAVGMARVATMLAFGVVRHRRANIFIQMCAATAVVFLLLTFLNFLTWRDNSLVTYFYDNMRHDYQVTQVLWVIVLPVVVAVALAFASVDKKSPPARPIAGRAGVAFSLIAIGLSVLLLVGVLTVGKDNHPAAAVNMNGLFEGLKKWQE
jgi:hypothetical protein